VNAETRAIGLLGGRAHVRTLFLRLLGVIFLAAFLSLLAQVTLLFGSRGLLPACAHLDAVRHAASPLEAPTVFRLTCSDAALRGAALTGAGLSVALILNVAPRCCLLALWALYLSFVTVGQEFLSFQWDNLLLEAAFFALFVTPGGLRPRRAPAPHPAAVFLMLWLVFRLHVESGASKLLLGDPGWWDLTALVSYYETAPLPTVAGWYAHQLPVWAHRLCALWTFVVELALPLLILGPRRLRPPVCAALIATQASIVLTGNYGFFNYLSATLCLFVLDDGHLDRLARRLGRPLAPVPPRPRRRGPRAWAPVVAAAVLVPISVVPFVPLTPLAPALARWTTPIQRAVRPLHSLNAYHLFAQMTRVRREAVLEGSADGVTWHAYEFRYKPGDPKRPPPFVAPHQPRVDFQLWFLLLGRRTHPRYVDALLARLLEEPVVVAPLFSHSPFPGAPPRLVRVAVYRYTVTDGAARRATGAWWDRELEGYSRPLTADELRG
jgi:hypothetical protein